MHDQQLQAVADPGVLHGLQLRSLPKAACPKLATAL